MAELKRLAGGILGGSKEKREVAVEDEEDSIAANSEDPGALANILADEPSHDLLGDDDQPEGRFGTRGLARRLAGVLRRAKPPFTVSISGAWGVGKTTLARQVEVLLDGPNVEDKDLVPVVYLDLWTADIADLRRRLALEVALRLDGTDPSDEDAREEKAKEFDKALRTTQVRQERPRFHIPGSRRAKLAGAVVFILASIAIFFIAQITVPTDTGTDPIGLRGVVAIVGPMVVWLLISSGVVFSVVTSSSSQSPLEEKVGLHRTFEKLVRSVEGRVVIIVDNLDRLPGEDAVRVLGEIRSFVEVKDSSCVFVVPLDRDALVRHLVSQMNGEKQAARDYLDKFFNLDVLLTKPVREDLRSWTRTDLVASLFPSAPEKVVSLVAEIVTSAADGSPRAAKRIANGIYARAYLLPKSARVVTLPHLAFVEALVARFPGALGALVTDPRRWLETARTFNNEADEDTRSRQLRPLLGLEEQPDPEKKEGPEVVELLKSLRQLLVLTPDLPTEGELRTILAARSDRQWSDIPSSADVQNALASGDGQAMTHLLREMDAPTRENALRVALDALREDLRNRWQQGAILKVNALATSVTDDPDHAGNLSRLADDLLAGGTEPNLLEQLQPDAVTLLFGDGPGRLSRRAQVMNSIVRELNAMGGQRGRATAWGDIVAVVSRSDDSSEMTGLIQQLDKLSDNDLAPVFDRPASAAVIASLGPRYAELIAGWNADTPIDTMIENARRAALATDHGWKPDAATLDKIATALRALFPSLVPEGLPAIEDAVSLFAGADAPTAETTAFAQALGTWPQQPIRGVELMLDVPATPTPVVAVVTGALANASFQDFEKLGDSREKMRALGVSYAEAAATKWQARQGADYAVVAFSSGNADDLAAFDRALVAVTDPGTYIEQIQALTPLLNATRHVTPADRLVSDLARRVPTLSVERLAELAVPTQQLAAVTDVGSVLEAMKGLSVPPDKIPALVASARSFVDAGVPSAADLAPAIGRLAATHGILHPADAEWLLDHGADIDDVRTGLLGAIRNSAVSEILTFTARLRGKVNANAFGLELVRRAANEAPGSRVPWLDEACNWKVPRKKADVETYDESLDQALVGDDDATEPVRLLRARLGGR